MTSTEQDVFRKGQLLSSRCPLPLASCTHVRTRTRRHRHARAHTHTRLPPTPVLAQSHILYAAFCTALSSFKVNVRKVFHSAWRSFSRLFLLSFSVTGACSLNTRFSVITFSTFYYYRECYTVVVWVCHFVCMSSSQKQWRRGERANGFFVIYHFSTLKI